MKGLFSDDPFVLLEDGRYSRHQIVSAAFHLSRALPEAPVVMNLYTQRHEFLVMLLAVAFKDGIIVLPPNTAENTLNGLMDAIDSRHKFIAGARTERWNFEDETVARIDVKHLLSSGLVDKAQLSPLLRKLPVAQIWLYTSGSTGQAKKVVKTWSQMMRLAAKAISRFGFDRTESPRCVVATVPSQHMFGLETTIFWPLFSRLKVWAGRPMFAEDIKAALDFVKPPVWLVSTPLHLKKLTQFDTEWPSYNESEDGLKVLSATAPLDVALAKTVGTKMHARVFEVFGSTETASIASRETLVSDEWRLYDHNCLEEDKNSGTYDVIMQDLDERHRLQDTIRTVSADRFRVLGRQSDLIKVAGKRASMTDLNRILQAVPGIEDGVFWRSEASERLQAFVVSNLSSQEIRQALSKSMDVVFLPRPLHFVKRIPRNEMGKIPFQALLELESQTREKVG